MQREEFKTLHVDLGCKAADDGVSGHGGCLRDKRVHAAAIAATAALAR